MHVSKAGVTVKIAASGLDDPNGKPTASLVMSGGGADANDTVLLSELSEAIKDEAALIADVRAAKPQLERLKPQADALEPGIDATFRKGGVPKKAEVRKNVQDAQRLIPLMQVRADDITQHAADFIRKVQKVLGTAAPAAAPAPAPAPAPPPAPPPEASTGKKPGKSKAGAAAPPPGEGTPAAEPKPAAKPKPASDDFEP